MEMVFIVIVTQMENFVKTLFYMGALILWSRKEPEFARWISF
jgi:hypothetical protein